MVSRVDTDNSNLEEKVRVATAVADARPLAAMEQVFLPYCGRGVSYRGALEERWPPGVVYACDRDVGCVREFSESWPEAEVVEALAERVEFAGRGPFATAFFDAFNSPFKAIRHWLHSAPLADDVGLVLTTAIRGYMVRRSQTYDFGRLGYGRFDRAAMRQQVDGFAGVVAGWLGTLEGVQAVRQVDAYQASGGSWIMYAGYVLDLSPGKKVDDDASAQQSGSWAELVESVSGPQEAAGPESWADLVESVSGAR